jgi:peptide/nickel transport system permease protein
VEHTRTRLPSPLPALAPVGPGSDGQYETALRQIGQWRIAWWRFKRHRLALLGSIVLLLMIVLAALGPLVAPPLVIYPYSLFKNTNLAPRLLPFNLFRLLGTDDAGEPISYYLLTGGRATLVIGIVGALVASLIGTLVGAVAGYFGRLVDTALMRLTDAFLTLPFLPLLLLLEYYLPDRGMVDYAVLFGVAGWAGVARLVRAYVLSFRQREFTEAARAMGASDLGVIFRHLLPNCIDVIVVSLTLNIALFMLTAANLEYLSGGMTDVTWADEILNFNVLGADWWTLVFPFLPLLLTVLATNLVGDGLRDAFDSSSTTTLIKWKDRPEGMTLGRVEQLVIRVSSPLGAFFTAGRQTDSADLAAAAARVLPPTSRLTTHLLRRYYRPGGLTRLIERTPWFLRLAPPIAILVFAMVIELIVHSPLAYAPNFSPPIRFAAIQGEGAYGAAALAGGGWAILAPDPAGDLLFTRWNRSGRPRQRQILARGVNAGSQPTVAAHGDRALAVWLAADDSTLMAAYAGSSTSHPFALLPAGGFPEHADAIAVPGGFDVLFDWRPPHSAAHQLYLARLVAGQTHAALRRIAADRDYGLLPRAALDGSGALDVLYLDRGVPGLWAWRFRRVWPDGRPASPGATTLGTIDFAPGHPPRVDAVPPDWASDVQRAPDGSVWAAWHAREDGSDFLALAHWSRTGRVLLAPAHLEEAAPDVIGLAALQRGGQIYQIGFIEADVAIHMVPFDRFGAQSSLVPERVNYDGGHTIAPHAATVYGRAAVLWEKVGLHSSLIEGTTYRPYTPPDLLTRLGLNIGNLWLNLALLLVGGPAGALLVAAANVLFLGAALLIWLVAGLLPRFVRWSAYLLGLTALIVAAFGLHPNALPAWILSMTPFGFPQNWVAAGGAVFAALWSGTFLFRRHEPVFRAALIAFIAIYAPALCSVAATIQSELTRI